MDSSLLSTLPAELRNAIYEMAVLEEDAIDVNIKPVSSRSPNSDSGHWPSWKPPALLQTCRQVRSEAAPIFYGNNTFAVSRWRFMRDASGLLILIKWLSLIGAESRALLRDIHIRDHALSDLDTLQLEKRLIKEGLALYDVSLPATQICFDHFMLLKTSPEGPYKPLWIPSEIVLDMFKHFTGRVLSVDDVVKYLRDSHPGVLL